MYNYLSKNGFRLAVMIASITALLFLVMAIFAGSDTDKLNGDYTSVSQYNFGLISTLLLLIISFTTVIYFAVKNIINHKAERGNLRKIGLITVLVFIVLMFLLRSSSQASLGNVMNNYDISKWTNGFISAGIMVSSVGILTALCLMIFMGIKNTFKS